MPNNALSQFLLIALLVPTVILWAYHLALRGYLEVGEKKRYASLFLTIVLLALWLTAYLLRRFGIDDLLLIPAFAVAIAVVIWKRGTFVPYRFSCAQCGKPLSVKRILFHDSGKCDTCDPLKKEGDPAP